MERVELPQRERPGSQLEPAFGDLVRLASRLCAAPIAFVALLDSGTFRFPVMLGLTEANLPRLTSFCTRTVQSSDPVVVAESASDDLPIGFGAGVPLVTSDGRVLGAFCVLDRAPHSFDAEQIEILQVFARQIVAQLDLHLLAAGGRVLVRPGRHEESYSTPANGREAGLVEQDGMIEDAYERGERSQGYLPVGEAEFAEARRTAELQATTARLRHEMAERTRAEEELARLLTLVEAQRQRLDAIIANIPGIVWEAWGHPTESPLQIDFISYYVETMLGYTPDECRATPDFISGIVHPEDREKLAQEVVRCFATEGGGRTQVRCAAKDGRVVWGEVRFSLIRDEMGRPAGLRGVLLDISDRMQAETALRESEERYRRLLEHSPEPIVVHNYEGILYANEAAVRLAGARSLDELVGVSIFDFIHPDSLEEVIARLRAMQEHGAPVELLEERFVALDGRIVDGEVIGIPISYQGKPVVQTIIHDITERKQRERELEAIVSVSAALRSAEGRDQLLATILDRVLDLLSAEGTVFELRDPRTGETVTELGRGTWAGVTGTRSPPGVGVSEYVMSSGRPYVNDNVLSDSRLVKPDLVGESSCVACVPLIAQEKAIGVLWAGRKTPIRPEELRLLGAIGDIAANAIHRATLAGETRLRAEQLAIVSTAGQTFAGTLDQAELYEKLYQVIVRLFPDIADAVITLFDPRAEALTTVYAVTAGKPSNGDNLSAIPPAADEEILREVIRTARPLVIGNLEARFNEPRRGGTGGSVLCVPMVARGAVLGAVQVRSQVPHRFIPADAELVAIVVNTAAVAIENLRLFARTRQQLEQLQALRAIDNAINASLDLRVTLHIFLDQVTSRLRVDAARVLLYDPQTQILHYAAGRGFRSREIEGERVRLGEDYAGKAVLERRTVVVSNLLDSAPWRSYSLEPERFVAYYGVPLIAKGQIKGVLELFHRSRHEPDDEWLDFLEALAGQASIAIDNAALFESLQRSNNELIQAYDLTIEGWSRALDMRDKETEGHSRRVCEMTLRVARAMGVSEPDLAHVRRGALLHDIGKMAIPDAILLKPEPLTEGEWEIMRRHPIYSYEMLATIPFLRPALEIPLYHHERWDGAGYPRGLKGEQIPLAARIFAVVDVWDALTTDRPYRKAWPPEKALDYLRSQAGSQFDPRVVSVFVEQLMPELSRIEQRDQAGASEEENPSQRS